MNSKKIRTDLGRLQSRLNNFSSEQLTMKEVSHFVRSFMTSKKKVNKEVLGTKRIIPQREIEVDCESCIDPNIKNQIRDILESHVAGKGDWESECSNTEGMLDLGEVTLPTVKYYSKNEGKRVKLLYSIAELGDMREVPLLHEMLEQEDNESIAILIKEIILNLLSESPEEGERNSRVVDSDHFGNHYVYNYLFNSIDLESQLIFLDEILEVGEQRDIYFLKSLFYHSEECIRKRANSVCVQLESRLLLSSKSTIKNSRKFTEIYGNALRNVYSVPFNQVVNEMLDFNRRFTQNDFVNKKEELRVGGKSARKTYEDILEKRIKEDTIFSIDFEVGVSEIKVKNSTIHPNLLATPNMEDYSLIAEMKFILKKIFKR